MPKFLSKYLAMAVLSLGMMIPSTALFAQEHPAPAMADAMRADGKIYVVVLVLATIFAGIIFYLYSLDKKISKLEKENPTA